MTHPLVVLSTADICTIHPWLIALTKCAFMHILYECELQKNYKTQKSLHLFAYWQMGSSEEHRPTSPSTLDWWSWWSSNDKHQAPGIYFADNQVFGFTIKPSKTNLKSMNLFFSVTNCTRPRSLLGWWCAWGRSLKICALPSVTYLSLSFLSCRSHMFPPEQAQQGLTQCIIFLPTPSWLCVSQKCLFSCYMRGSMATHRHEKAPHQVDVPAPEPFSLWGVVGGDIFLVIDFDTGSSD